MQTHIKQVLYLYFYASKIEIVNNFSCLLTLVFTIWVRVKFEI